MENKKTKRRKQLTKRQMDFINDLFNSGLEESEVLARHKLSLMVYRKWLGEKIFQDELEFRKVLIQRQSELLMAKYSTVATVKLIELLDSGNKETVRKACLDILAANKEKEKSKPDSAKDKDEPEPSEQLSPETASKLLAALAQDKNDKTKGQL